MSELPSPAPEKERKEITDFRKDYGDALTRALVSAEHTNTEGWRNLYGEHVDTERKSRDALALRMDGFSEELRQRLLDEDGEKQLGECKKTAAELRQQEYFWRRQVVDPVIAPLHECNAIIEKYRGMARSAATMAPLHTRGLLEQMEDAIDSVPTVKFITSSGRLIVDNPGERGTH